MINFKYFFCVSFALGLSITGCTRGGSGGGSDSSPDPDPDPGGPNQFTVTVSAGSGGSVNPANVNVDAGMTANLVVTPDSGFTIDSVSGCSGSLNGSTYTTGAISADCSITASFVATTTGGGNGNKVAYIAYELNVDDSDELYSVNIDGSNPQKLNGELVEGGEVLSYVWSGDGSRVVYSADQEVDQRVELYSVLPDGSSNINLNGDPLDASGVVEYKLSPSGDIVAYLAREDANDKVELYTVAIDGTNRVKVNQDLVAGGNVTDFIWSPDGSALLYKADLEVNEVEELYIANADGSNHRNINNDLLTDEGIIEYEWSPLGGYVSYMVTNDDANTSLAFETKSLFTFDVTNDSIATVLERRIIQNVLWKEDDSKLAVSDKNIILGFAIRFVEAYSTIWVSNPDGTDLVDMTQLLPKDLYLTRFLQEEPRQFSFVPGSDDFLILSYDQGSPSTTNFYVLSTSDGSIIDTESAEGLGGGFLNYQLGLDPSSSFFTNEQRIRFYDQQKYKPFTFSPDGRYIIINDHASSIYDTQTNSLLSLRGFNPISPYIATWIEQSGTFLLTRTDGSFEPETYKRFFINPVIVNPLNSLIVSINQLLGGDTTVAQAVNPRLIGDNVFFDNYPNPREQVPLVTIGIDGMGLATLSEEGIGARVADYSLVPEISKVVYLGDCDFGLICAQKALFSVSLDGSDRVKINSGPLFQSLVRSFSVQP